MESKFTTIWNSLKRTLDRADFRTAMDTVPSRCSAIGHKPKQELEEKG